ncbi:hypothetical protein [Hoeflea sp.]|uniref:hypothetical protein n=1 Tax=Hoeflea sp. TaxID=1940281 RepID=UPI003A93F5F3
MLPKPTLISPADLLSILGRLNPESLLLRRGETGLQAEELEALWRKIAFSYDPPRRLETIEYLLLIMNEARSIDAQGYLTKVLFPWIGMKRLLQRQARSIVDDIERISGLEAYTTEDAAHIANKIYRPLVADIFDPYLTLLVGTYAFIDGTFVSIEASNYGALERNKAEWIDSRIRKLGGPANLLDGYDPIVRNAVSHAGSGGIVYDERSILFREVKRGPEPKVETRRWSHDELHWHVLALIELVMSIDAAVDIFGLDNMDLLNEKEIADHALYHVYDRQDRLELVKPMQKKLKKIRASKTISSEEKLDFLGKLLFLQCAERGIPCTSVAFNHEMSACIVSLPVSSEPDSDDEIRQEMMILIRYAILARAVFSTMFEQFYIDGQVDDKTVVRVLLHGVPLDEYAQETAGLADLIDDAKLWVGGVWVKITIDKDALAACEDASLGPRFPRRGRPV